MSEIQYLNNNKNRTYRFVLFMISFMMVFIIFAPRIALATCATYCPTQGYPYASCPVGVEEDDCLAAEPGFGTIRDWLDTGPDTGCSLTIHCWCGRDYSSVTCLRLNVISGWSAVGGGGCYIFGTILNPGGAIQTKGACGFGEPTASDKDYAECELNKCRSGTTGHDGEQCDVDRNCNNRGGNSPTEFVDLTGNYYTWSLPFAYHDGKWDASNQQCVKCSGNKKTGKYGDTLGLYVSCFGTILPSGDIADTCESACGAECESNADCSSGTCQADCTCYTAPPTTCTISGTPYANGACNPTNKCQYCDVSQSTIAWSSVPSGKVCVSNSLVIVSATNYCNYGEDCSTGDCSAQKWYTSCSGAGACRAAGTSPPTDSYIVPITASNSKVLKSDCTEVAVSSSYHCGEQGTCTSISTCNGEWLYKGCYSGSCSNSASYGYTDTTDDSACDDEICSSTAYCSGCTRYPQKRCSDGSCLGYNGANCNPYSCSGSSCTSICTKGLCGATCANDVDCPGSTCDLATCTCVGGCTKANPIVTLSPSSQSGKPGDLKSYTVSITNNDNSACGSSTFNIIASVCSSSWTCTPSSASKTISPGSTDSSVTLNVTSSVSAANGDYTISVTVTNSGFPSYSGTGSAIYTVTSTPPPVGINPPQVRTVPISENGTVGTNSATIWGQLTDMGGASSCLVWFEYKKITDATWTKACGKTMTSNGFFSCDLTGLTSTTYNFKAFAKNSGSW